MKNMFLAAVAAVAVTGGAVARTISVKSPDGLNEIRLDTEPTLSYSVLRAGVERVSPTPISRNKRVRYAEQNSAELAE